MGPGNSPIPFREEKGHLWLPVVKKHNKHLFSDNNMRGA